MSMYLYLSQFCGLFLDATAEYHELLHVNNALQVDLYCLSLVFHFLLQL